jgi:hypothetical protein
VTPAPPGAAAPAEPRGGTGAAAAAPAGAVPATAPTASPLNPSPDEFPKPATAPAGSEIDALMSRVAALRSRIAALSAALFSSQLRIEVRSAGDSVRVKALRVSLDGGVVYTAPSQVVFEQPEVVYEHAVAAGPHVVAIEVERQDIRQPQFSTWQASRFVVVVPEQRRLWTRLTLDAESSMGEDFAEDEAGQYELSVRLNAEVAE